MGIKLQNGPQNFKLPYYHPLHVWFPEATNNNQGQTMMDLWRSKTFIQAKWLYLIKIHLKLQVLYYHPLSKTKDKQSCTLDILRCSSNKNGHKTSKYTSNFKFFYYHTFHMWLLLATKNNQRVNNDQPWKFWDFYPKKIGTTTQNMSKTSNFPHHPFSNNGWNCTLIQT